MTVAQFITTRYILYSVLSAIEIGQSVKLWGGRGKKMTKCPSKNRHTWHGGCSKSLSLLGDSEPRGGFADLRDFSTLQHFFTMNVQYDLIFITDF